MIPHILSLVMLFLTVTDALLAVVELPCSANTTTAPVESNTTYTLTNCVLPADADPILLLVAVGVSAVDITVDVVGGNVLPCLLMRPPNQRAERIAVTVRGARVGPRLNAYPLRGMLSISSVVLVTNVAVVVRDSTVDLTIIGAFTELTSLLLQVQGTPIHAASVIISNSSLALSFSGTFDIATNIGLVGLSLTGNSTDVSMLVSRSVIKVHVNATTVDIPTTGVSTSIVLVQCFAKFTPCSIYGVHFNASDGSSLTVQCDGIGGVTNTSGALIGGGFNVDIVNCFVVWLQDLSVMMEANTNITVRYRCVQSCGLTIGGHEHANTLSVAGYLDNSTAKGLVVVAVGAHFTLESTRSSGVVSVVQLEQLVASRINFTSCVVRTAVRGQDAGSHSRVGSIFMSEVDVTMMTVSLDRVVMVSTTESGGCPSATSVAVNMIGTLVGVAIWLDAVSLAADAVNGTVTVQSFAALAVGRLTMYAALINLSPALSTSVVSAGVNMSIIVTDCWVVAQHSTYLPYPLPFMLLVASVIAALTSSMSLVNSTIRLSNVHIQRNEPTLTGPATWFPSTLNGMRFNVTSVAMFIDLYAAAPPAIANVLAQLLKTSIAAFATHVAVNISLTTNCTIGYESRLGAIPTDGIALIVLPSVLKRSVVVIKDAAILMKRLDDEAGGVAVACVGGARIETSSVAVLRVNPGGIALVSADGSNLTLVGNATTLAFEAIQVAALAIDVIDANRVNPIVTGVGTINFDSKDAGEGGISTTMLVPTEPLGPFLSVAQSSFTGYTNLVPGAQLHIVKGNVRRVLLLGCNLWNGAPLPQACVGAGDRTLMSLIEYPRGVFNGTSVMCQGIQTETSTSTMSMSGDMHFVEQQLPIEASSSAATATSVLIYAALLPTVVGRGEGHGGAAFIIPVCGTQHQQRRQQHCPNVQSAH